MGNGAKLEIWRGIVDNSKDESIAKWTGNDSFQWKIGNEKMKLFLEDIWYGNRPEKVEFPRLYRLAKDKQGTVEMYSRNEDFVDVQWEEYFVRVVFAREKDLLNKLKAMVEKRKLINEVEDRLRWKHDRKGVLSVKRLTELLIGGGVPALNFSFDKI